MRRPFISGAIRGADEVRIRIGVIVDEPSERIRQQTYGAAAAVRIRDQQPVTQDIREGERRTQYSTVYQVSVSSESRNCL